ncbi:MAG: NIPSNAP family protein [Chloroflexota bacterium]
MIYDLRTYTLKPRSVPQALELFGRSMPIRQRYSPLGGMFSTEVGPLNQIVHIWPYKDLAALERIRDEAASDPSRMWPPPGLREHMVIQQSEILAPAPFMAPWEGPQHLGNIYELRIYDLVPGSRMELMKNWSARIDARRAYSPLVGCWLSTGVGGVGNQLFHLWAYGSFEERLRIREETIAQGVWPVDDGRHYIRQQNKLLIPAPFSPLH